MTMALQCGFDTLERHDTFRMSLDVQIYFRIKDKVAYK